MPFISTLHPNLIEILFVWMFKTDEQANAIGINEGLLEESLFWYRVGVILINLAKTSDYVEIACFFIDEIYLDNKIKGKTCFECKRPLKSRNTSVFLVLKGLLMSLLLDYKVEQSSYFVYHTRIDAKIRECGHMFHRECFKKNIDKCSYCN